MDVLQEARDISKKSFLGHVFSTTDEGKAEILNVVQYATLGIIPIVLLNKAIQRFIPEADAEKSSLELVVEVLLQTINEDVTKFMAFFQLVDSSKIQNENSNVENAEFSYNKKNEYNEKNPQNTVSANWGKVGRNSPCPCGSGKKFKNCHGRN